LFIAFVCQILILDIAKKKIMKIAYVNAIKKINVNPEDKYES
jgi:hypothetical protein